MVVIASSDGHVRALTTGGLAITVIPLPGPLVCLAAHGGDVMMCYHGAVGELEE